VHPSAACPPERSSDDQVLRRQAVSLDDLPGSHRERMAENRAVAGEGARSPGPRLAVRRGRPHRTPSLRSPSGFASGPRSSDPLAGPPRPSPGRVRPWDYPRSGRAAGGRVPACELGLAIPADALDEGHRTFSLVLAWRQERRGGFFDPPFASSAKCQHLSHTVQTKASRAGPIPRRPGSSVPSCPNSCARGSPLRRPARR